MDYVIKCEKCGKIFTNQQGRATHIKWIHETPPRYQCIVCSKSFRDSHNLNRHVNAKHEKEHARGALKVCPVCDCQFFKKFAQEHFEEHGYIMETESLKFIDWSTFQQWKTLMEKETNSKFIKQRAQRTVQHGVIINEYSCHRSGHFKSRCQGGRNLKVRSSKKIGAYCPAIIVTQSQPSGEVTVIFQKTHVGHEKEVARQSMTEVLVDQLFSPAQTDISYLEERKVVIQAKLSEIVNSVKSTAGLEALERHLAPLPLIINSAEEAASVNFPQVYLNQESPNKASTPQRKVFSKKKASLAKKSNLSSPSRSECDAVAFSSVIVLSQDYTL